MGQDHVESVLGHQSAFTKSDEVEDDVDRFRES